jgi:hypothetical protein
LLGLESFSLTMVVLLSSSTDASQPCNQRGKVR